MKRSLLFKLILCFFICSACFFGLINSIGAHFIEEKIIESKNGELNRMGAEATDILSSLNFNHSAPSIDILSFAEQMSETFDCTIIITNENRSFKIQAGDDINSNDYSITYHGKFNGANNINYYLGMYRSLDCIESVRSNMMTVLNLITLGLCVIVALIFILVYFMNYVKKI